MRKPTSQKRFLTPEQVPEETKQILKELYLTEKGMTIARAALLLRLSQQTSSRILNDMGVVRTRSNMQSKAKKAAKRKKREM